MIRSLSTCLVLTLVAASGVARAEDDQPTTSQPADFEGPRMRIRTPVEAFVPHEAQISTVLYLNRCIGGCPVVKGGVNDARANTSTIPVGAGPFTVSEYALSNGTTGSGADSEWNAVVKCMKEVYSPFNVQIVETRPTSGLSFHQAIVAGNPPDIGRGNDILGIAPLAGDCSPQDNVISFSFANSHGSGDRVNNICWTAAQESAHAFGLDHEFSYIKDGRSACNDPMTYRTDCGGQKFFRNDAAKCGENVARDCMCGATQNSHQKILSVFEGGTVITSPPTVTVIFPLDGGILAPGAMVNARGFSQRGIARMELFLNGHKWSDVAGAEFGNAGQPETNYQLPVPATVPNSIIDVVVKAYDDLGAMSESPKVTITKGAACTTDESCGLKGMKCGAGKCAWDPPTGAIGEDCEYNEFCLSNKCQATTEGSICTQDCSPGIQDQCPMGFACQMTSPGFGLCLAAAPVDEGGCCSAGDQPGALWIHGGFAAFVLGMVIRRRKRRSV